MSDSTDAPEARDKFARRLGGLGLIVSSLSLLVSSCQAYTGWLSLQDDRAALVKLEADNPTGLYGNPVVQMRIRNVSNWPIRNAKVGARLKLLAPDNAASIYDDLEFVTQDIQLQDAERQTVHAKNTDEQIALWEKGELLLIGAIEVMWTDRGAWFSSKSRRCWAWTLGGDFACEDLINKPSQARAHVQNFIAGHPNPTREELDTRKKSDSPAN